SFTRIILAKVPSTVSINTATKSHNNAPRQLRLTTATRASNPITNPLAVKICTPQASSFRPALNAGSESVGSVFISVLRAPREDFSRGGATALRQCFLVAWLRRRVKNYDWYLIKDR